MSVEAREIIAVSGDARELLGILLDRLEDRPDRTRLPSVRPPEAWSSAAQRDTFERVLANAERCGAITVERGRGEARHLVQRIRLRDAAALYAFLDRTPRADMGAKASADLARATVRTPESLQAQDMIAEAWRCCGRAFGLDMDKLAQAREFLIALDAVAGRDPMDRRDLRTFSGQETDDTKLLERQAGRIAQFFKQTGKIDPELTEHAAMAALGLEKFPQPVLISGPISVAGAHLGGLTYAGLAPEDAPLVEPVGEIRSVLTIENLASFNRHVREAKQSADVVVFTGGFPSRAVAAAVAAISRWPGLDRIHHWGDIDVGGLRIAIHLTTLSQVPVVPHLMAAELARRSGTPGKQAPAFGLPPDHPWHALAAFLEGEPYFLEQERVDPAQVD